MPEAKDRLEVERLKNLATGFGWGFQKEEYVGDDLVVTFTRKREPVEVEDSAGPG